MNKKITIYGLGYVGTSLGAMLAQKNSVRIIDVDKKKIELLNSKKAPIYEPLIDEYLIKKDLDIKATSNLDDFSDSDFIILALPTNYDEEKDFFDTSILENIIKLIKSKSPEIPIIIKSTVYIGFSDFINKKYKCSNIIFSPEFLREGSALYDNLNPSRIIVGSFSSEANSFAVLLKECIEPEAKRNSVKVLFTNSKEAESIKLFSNSYLAMRIAFFNELDTFAIKTKVSSKSIIDGVSCDPRIGDHYNNPSFGYGGYCLPKDTKQLLANFNNIPQNIFSAIVKSNETRISFITKEILSMSPKKVGIYKLAMKKDSDNYRQSAVISIMKKLNKENIEIIVYEPGINLEIFESYKIINSLAEFKKKSDIIIANRLDDSLNDVIFKVYSRDIYNFS